MSTENKCPFQPALRMRPGLPPNIPDRMANLPLDERGYPVPFFVPRLEDGSPEFRAMDGHKWKACVNDKRCWVCGHKLGKWFTFVIGPMCAINRTTGEPPSHLDCATWSVQACPFLSKPQMVRREDEFTEECMQNISGIGLRRNPGVSLLWTTGTYKVFRDPNNRPLIEIGPHEHLSWWREGRQATRAEVLESIDSGLPLLHEACELEIESERPAAYAEVDQRYKAVMELLPE